MAIIHDTEHRLSREPGLCIDKLDDGTFEYAFQFGIVSFFFIEEMGSRGMVTGAVFLKIDGFPMISKREGGYQYGYNILLGCMRKTRRKFKF